MRIIFKCQKISLRVLLSICLIFCQFQPDVAYKSAAYIKKRVFGKVKTTLNASLFRFHGVDKGNVLHQHVVDIKLRR